jgi:hypothetical protein
MGPQAHHLDIRIRREQHMTATQPRYSRGADMARPWTPHDTMRGGVA